MSIRNYEKKNAWNIRRLVGGSLGQMNHRTSVIYYKLTNLNSYQNNCRRQGSNSQPSDLKAVVPTTTQRRFHIHWDHVLTWYPGKTNIVQLLQQRCTTYNCTRCCYCARTTCYVAAVRRHITASPIQSQKLYPRKLKTADSIVFNWCLSVCLFVLTDYLYYCCRSPAYRCVPDTVPEILS